MIVGAAGINPNGSGWNGIGSGYYNVNCSISHIVLFSIFLSLNRRILYPDGKNSFEIGHLSWYVHMPCAVVIPYSAHF